MDIHFWVYLAFSEGLKIESKEEEEKKGSHLVVLQFMAQIYNSKSGDG